MLASASEARAALLRAAGVPFTVLPAQLDEAPLRAALRARDASPQDAATALAEAKARQVMQRLGPDAVVLGADQILVLEGNWLEKPASIEAARRQLEQLRGRDHQLVSAAVLMGGAGRLWQIADRASLRMREFTDRFLERYLECVGSRILGSVGGYEVEGMGIQLFARIEGDHFTIRGLPLLPLLEALHVQGILER